MSNKPKRRAFAAPSRVLRNTLLTWAAGLILIAMPATRVSSLGEVLLLMPFVIALSITAHELGHLFAARIGGLRPVILLLGNVWIRFVGPRPRVGMSSAFLVGGYVVVSPVREPSRFSLILFLLGGAIANASMLIAPFAVLIVLALLFQHSAQPILQIGAPIAVLFAIYNFWLLPIAVTLLLVGSLLVLAQSSAVAPFIYTLF